MFSSIFLLRSFMKKWLFCLLLAPVFAHAQFDSAYYRRSDFSRFADGFAYTLSSPARWQEKDWITFGGLIAGTALVSLADEPLRDVLKGPGKKVFDGVERVGFHAGKPYSAILLSSGFYLTGLALKDEWANDTGLMLGVSFLTSGVVQTVMKTAVGRARPGAEYGNYYFVPFSDAAAFHAFPSGHQAVALNTSIILASRVKSPVLKVVFYSTAAITAFSRMYTDKHWFSDIAFGGALAYFTANTAMHRLENNKFKKKGNSLTWQVRPFPGGFKVRALIP